MSKEKKISIRHYENKNLKTFRFNGEEIHQLYFQITYERKNFNFKCALIDEFTINKIQFPSKEWSHYMHPDWEVVKDKIIEHNLNLINLIINEIKIKESDFKLEAFRKYYELYSKNIFEYIDRYFLEVLLNFLEKGHYDNLLNIIRKGKVDFFQLLALIQELNSSLYSELNNKLVTNISIYEIYLKLKKWNIETEVYYSDESGLTYYTKHDQVYNELTFNTYISILEWEKFSKELTDNIAYFIDETLIEPKFDNNNKQIGLYISKNDQLEMTKNIELFVNTIDGIVKQIKSDYPEE